VLAEVMGVRRTMIAQVEKGKGEYAETYLISVKEYFDIVGLPLTGQEHIYFKGRMYFWRELIRGKRMDEARAIHKEVANMDNLVPCDYSMVILCRIIEAQLLLADGNKEAAGEKLNFSQSCIDNMNDENFFHYSYSKGLLCNSQGCYEQGLKFFLKAYDMTEDHKYLLPKEDEWLYYRIAWCYSYIEIPYRAIYFLQEAKQVPNKSSIADCTLYIDLLLALNYVKTNQRKEAKKLLDKCMLNAEIIKSKEDIGQVLFCYGYMFKTAKDWKPAISYFDKALECLDENSDNYYAAIFNKIHCTIHARTFTKARKQLKQVKVVNGENKKSLTIYFEAQLHYLDVYSNMTSYNNTKSSEYIENIAIPCFIEEHDYLIAVDFYILLSLHYEKLKSTKKSLLMIKYSHDIISRCFINHGEEI